MKFDPFGTALTLASSREEQLAIDIVSAVRDAVGKNVDLAIEAHSRFSLSTAIRIGNKLEPFSPAWFEEPVPHQNAEALGQVATHVNVPVAAGESLFSKQQVAELLGQRIDIINFEPLHMTGILGSREVAGG